MTNQDNAIDIAELKTRVDGHADTLQRHDERLTKHDEAIISLREGMAKVATRDDVAELRNAVNRQFFDQLKQAHDSIPSKTAALAALGSALVTAAGFMLAHFRA
ncbi:hypothetical protein [Paraburkholderia oxyphila]|uniref:hypothetical protein n=1 Tax=Paraburkholderia oxyphila TaxID=614212 RepID=UPI000483CE25|nr:hypothetical protein [Paraburkholderia oxyphila]